MNSLHTSILLAVCIFTLAHSTQSAAITAPESDLVPLGAESNAAQILEHPAPAAATDLFAIENDGVALESASAPELSRPARQLFYPSFGGGGGYYNRYYRPYGGYGGYGGFGGYGYPFYNYGYGRYNPYYGYPRPIYG